MDKEVNEEHIELCPFCGGQADYSFYGEYRYIVCKECKACSKKISCKDNDYKYKLLELWNNRK